MKIILFLIVFGTLAQPLKVSAQPDFKNQGEQEDYEAAQLFKNDYSKHTFKKFRGKITQLSDDLIRYDSTTLKIYTSNSALKNIFSSGIFYPEIFDDPRTQHETPKNIRLQDSPVTVVYDNIQGTLKKDSIAIFNVEELTFLETSSKVRRFRMWVYSGRVLNPTVYFFELTNVSALSDTSLSEFVKKAKLTFVKTGWIII